MTIFRGGQSTDINLIGMRHGSGTMMTMVIVSPLLMRSTVVIGIKSLKIIIFIGRFVLASILAGAVVPGLGMPQLGPTIFCATLMWVRTPLIRGKVGETSRG